WILIVPFPTNTSLSGRYSLPTENPRPPAGQHVLMVDGWIYPRTSGTLAFDLGRDVAFSGTIDREPIDTVRSDATVRLPVRTGAHEVHLRLDLNRTDWRFVPTWNDGNVFSAITTSVNALAPAHLLIARWGWWITPALVALLIAGWSVASLRAIASPGAMSWA